jgi:leader peptidase (prepilin peptidase) / N-methyltransferase
VSTLAGVLAALLGVGGGAAVQRSAARFVAAPDPAPVTLGGAPASDTPRPARSVSARVPRAVPIVVTAIWCGLTGLRFGFSWSLPAFLLLATAGVLLAVIDLEHRLIPNRILIPATGGAALLLALATATTGAWSHLLGAALGGVVLFLFFLVLALIAPAGLGMGDVKLAGLLGLYLGWLGWSAVVVGAVAGFVVQAVVALVLLAARRVGLKGEIPFGPAMLAGAALAILGASWTSAFFSATGRG